MSDLIGVLSDLGAARLVVLGDVMLDRHCWGEAERVSPEAPALVLRRQREEARPGGAASVAVMAAALGAEVRLAGVMGDDADGLLLGGLLDEAGVGREGVLVEPGRQTTAKERFVARTPGRPDQHLLRADREVRGPLPASAEARLLGWLRRRLAECDAVLVADHGKGVCSPALLGVVLAEANDRGVPVLVDPARLPEHGRYRGADVLAPNRAEAQAVLGREIGPGEVAVGAARMLAARTGVPALLLKLDRDGMVLVRPGRPACVYPALARSVVDVTGAGDAVLAMLGLCRAAGIDLDVAVRLAAAAAAVEVGKEGAAALSRSEVAAELRHQAGAAGKVVALEDMAELAEQYREEGKTVVLSNGCFDVLHAGHAAYLEAAARLGDVLVVAVNDDAGVRRLKGPGRPALGQNDRAALLAALGCVAHVVVFSGETPHEVLRKVRPAVLVKGGDYRPEEVVGREVVEGYGGRVCVTGRQPGPSTTQLLAGLRQAVAG